MRVSIKDIAKAAGVSHSTVSRALSDSPLVNAETKSRIQSLAREMGYSPDAQARSLVMGRTLTLGVVVTVLTDPFIAEIVQAVEDTAHEYGYSVVLASSSAESEREIAAVEMLHSKRVDGVIVTSSRVGALYQQYLDTFRRARMTEPHREMLESLLDSIYTHLLAAIAAGRNTTADRISDLFDQVPISADQACELGLLDAVCYEDELPDYLGQDRKPVALIPWEQARRLVIRPQHWTSRFRIGVISIEGMIVAGPSRRPPLPLPLPLPATQAGADTLIRQLRAAAQDRTLAAVVLHVDSPGGSAFASDLIWREVALLHRHKPVVVYMGNRAASGGYYVSVPANALVAQPTTLTGSIGIWGGKIVTRGLYARIRANREQVLRGKSAALYADTAPFSDEERARIRAEIGAGYARFKARVAEGRGMTDEQVEAVARGRVWTGEQALTLGLIDQLGDLRAAADKARELAGLDPRRHVRLVPVPIPKRYLRPAVPTTDIAEWVNALWQLTQERLFALAPWMILLQDWTLAKIAT